MTNVAIVILNYNGVSHLRTYLPSVLANKDQFSTIWVADNGSTDASLRILEEEFPEVKILALGQNYGFAEGYNQALKQIDGDYYVLLNSDVAVDANWLSPLLQRMEEDETVGICQPRILSHRQQDAFEYAGAAGGWLDKYGYPFCRGRIFDTVEKAEGRYTDATEIFWASGCAMMVRAELYKGLGGLDGDYFAHMEEIDFCWRAKRAGYKVMVYPESTVYHLGGGTLNYSNPRKTFLNFRNSLYTLYKNEKGWTMMSKVFMRLCLDAPAAYQFLFKGQWRDFIAIAKAHWSFFRKIPTLNTKKKKEQEQIDAHRIGPDRTTWGRYSKSIVWAYFAKGKKTFKEL